jgi:O-antigen/teichoic acid export membrane protein
MSLKKDTIWASIDTFVNQAAGLIFRLLLARQLAPADFGVLAMANTTIAILQMINDFGISSTIIQRKQNAMTADFFSAAFTAAIFISGALFLLNQTVIADASAAFFHNAQVENLVRVLGLVFLFLPFSSLSQALLLRSRKFSTIARSRTVAQAVGITAGSIYLFTFKSLWALPVQILSTQLTVAVLFYLASPWKPRIFWNSHLRRELFGFSGLVFLNNFLNSIAKNLDQIILGRFVGTGQLGVYSLSFYLTDTVRTSLMSIMNRVMLVHYSENQENKELLQRDYLRTLRWNVDLIFPAMLVLIFAGPILIPQVLGAKWAEIGPTLQLLAIAVMVHAAGGSTSPLFVAVGKPGLDLKIFASTTCGILMPAVFLGAYYGGIVGAALGACIAKSVAIIVRQVVLSQVIDLPARTYLGTLAVCSLKYLPIPVLFVILDASGFARSPAIEISCVGLLGCVYGALFAFRFLKDPNF